MSLKLQFNKQGEFFILKHRNIARKTHRMKKMLAIKTFYFCGVAFSDRENKKFYC